MITAEHPPKIVSAGTVIGLRELMYPRVRRDNVMQRAGGRSLGML